VFPIYFNAKLGVPEDAFFKYMPAIAFGAFDIGTEKDNTNYDIVYGLLAKNIWKLGRFSVGYYTGNSKLLLDFSKVDPDGTSPKEKQLRRRQFRVVVCDNSGRQLYHRL
jgi:hypothetical protein